MRGTMRENLILTNRGGEEEATNGIPCVYDVEEAEAWGTRRQCPWAPFCLVLVLEAKLWQWPQVRKNDLNYPKQSLNSGQQHHDKMSCPSWHKQQSNCFSHHSINKSLQQVYTNNGGTGAIKTHFTMVSATLDPPGPSTAMHKLSSKKSSQTQGQGTSGECLLGLPAVLLSIFALLVSHSAGSLMRSIMQSFDPGPRTPAHRGPSLCEHKALCFAGAESAGLSSFLGPSEGCCYSSCSCSSTFFS